MSSRDAGYAFGQLVFGVGVPLVVLAAICWGIIALVRSTRKSSVSAVDGALFMRFALLPGERIGIVWPAAHPAGNPMVATITSTGVFALNYAVEQAPPVRLRPEGMAVAVGSTQMITPGATEPMVDVTLSGPDQAPMTFRIAQSGAKALAAWAKAPR